MINHLVLFKWKPGTTSGQEAAASAKFADLCGVVPGLLSISSGCQNSPEGLGKDFHFGVVAVFTDAAARDAYLPHPAHLAVVAGLKLMIDDVMVLDFAFPGPAAAVVAKGASAPAKASRPSRRKAGHGKQRKGKR